MSTSKHTPGPWVIKQPAYDIARGLPVTRLEVNAEHNGMYKRYVAEVRSVDNQGLDNTDANAHLIAAAPAMYEALQSILAEVTNDTDGLDAAELYEIIYFIRGKAKSALAQAEGIVK